ncbi:MAG TPA: oxidoreductase [Firmicutes bacterium]|jgi:NAD(P)-dependent dehydrogenase (short-subunit alcohol dehydrogenase family)|nr:oxidoreductase [Bacillota bacterium]
MKDRFDLSGKIVVITGGAGFLGQKHAEAVAEFGGIPVILDLNPIQIDTVIENIRRQYPTQAAGFVADITQEAQVEKICQEILAQFGRIDALINNAANNPKIDDTNQLQNVSRLENFSLEQWNVDLAVGLTGSFLCSKYFGTSMAAAGGGSIVNIASDLGVIAPNQNLYKREGVPEQSQNVKPVSYSVVKTGLIGLTRYLATYWPEKGVRCNAICPGGVSNGQGELFLSRISSLIPMARMARPDELKGAIVFLISAASSYMNGAVIMVDGGRSVW